MKILFLVLLLALTGCGGFFPGPTLATINIDPTTSVLHPHMFQQFVATGVYTDGSHKDLTRSVIWSSTNSVITIDQIGGATIQAVGKASVQATKDNVVGSLAIDVTAE